ncbi:MAG: glycosyltransferase [Acidobacteria bacterium]|nr:glycosyltransferase [Acidobacteriota bacterium]
MRGPRISVLIATADRPELLADCLAHLRRSPFEGVEIIVLDQSRNLQHREPEEDGPERWLRHVHCPRRGKSAALNRGIAEAKGGLLAFTDDDCRVAENWLEEMHRACVDTRGEVALTGRVLAGEREGDAVIAPSLLDEGQEREYRRPAFRDVLFGNNMAIPAPVLRRVGPFDETLGPGTSWPAAEDNDLGYRLLRARVPIRYLPNLVVTHRSWRKPRQQQGLYRDYGIGQGAFYGKHARRGNLHMVARMARSLWDGGRDAAGAAVLGRGHDLRASLSFSEGLVRGFVGATLAGGGSPRASLQAEKS